MRRGRMGFEEGGPDVSPAAPEPGLRAGKVRRDAEGSPWRRGLLQGVRAVSGRTSSYDKNLSVVRLFDIHCLDIRT